MKRTFLIGLAVTMCGIGAVSLWAGGGQAASSGSARADNGVVEIIWQYPSPGNLGSGFQDVENALNAMMEKDIGVRVRFEPVGLSTSQQQATLMISAGEQLDVCLTAFTSVGNLVENGLIVPLDDLITRYGQDIREHCGVLVDMCSYNGQVYGVPPAYIQGESYGYAIKNEYLRKYNISVDTDKLYTLAELERIFEVIKAGEGRNFYCLIPSNTDENPLNSNYLAFDRITGSQSGGVLMLNRNFTDTTIYNLFDTPEYRSYAELMYSWAQKGYISPDAAVNTESTQTLLATNNYLGHFYYYWPADNSDAGTTLGGLDLTALQLVPRYVANNGGQRLQWNIPITSGNKEKAMQAINYIYKNKLATWLIQFGIEGQSYEVVEKNDSAQVIRYLGETAALPYYNPYGLWGDRLEWPAVYPLPIGFNVRRKSIDRATPATRHSPGIGYAFVQTPVATEIAAVNTVIAQYTPQFNTGSVNPTAALPQFISALKAAGIDRVIAENQRQFNAWLAAKK
jgi:putative aldouronate transport system substrate-binding protein